MENNEENNRRNELVRFLLCHRMINVMKNVSILNEIKEGAEALKNEYVEIHEDFSTYIRNLDFAEMLKRLENYEKKIAAYREEVGNKLSTIDITDEERSRLLRWVDNIKIHLEEEILFIRREEANLPPIIKENINWIRSSGIIEEAAKRRKDS